MSERRGESTCGWALRLADVTAARMETTGSDDKEERERGRCIDRRLRTQGREGEKDRGEIYGIAKGFARQRSVQEEARKLAGRMNDDDRVQETRRGGG